MAIPDKAQAWHQPILTERVKRLLSGGEKIASWEEAKKRIREYTARITTTNNNGSDGSEYR